jgi:arylsulfatase A-like enzyme
MTDEEVQYIAKRHEDRQESLLAVDRAVAAIVDALRRTGDLDDTYIFFTSDNGYMQGEHDIASGKVVAYDPSTQVPLLLRGPGIPHGRVSDELVGNIDLAPTIVDIGHASPGKQMDGRSLLPYARDPGLRSQRPLLHETAGPGYTPIREHDAGEVQPVQPVLSYRAVRTDRWLSIEYSGGPRELYDLKRDPYELQSLDADPAYRPVTAALHRILHGLVHCRGATCRANAPPVMPP